jgi:amidophosphoribosyltransferase
MWIQGEALFIDAAGEFSRQQCANNPKLKPCIFEHVYFARPDSLMDGISVYKTRMRQGERLAHKIMRERPNHDIDVVIPIPDTSRVAGQALAHELGVKFREGFMKNRYIGRTFIMPGQTQRKKSVRQKLNPVPLEFEGKTVLLVDDSIVRGTTVPADHSNGAGLGCEAGLFCVCGTAGEVSPMCTASICQQRRSWSLTGGPIDEISEHIGADWLIYQEIDDLIECSREGNSLVDGFELSVFDGQYQTGIIDDAYLIGLSDARADDSVDRADGALVGLHNRS